MLKLKIGLIGCGGIMNGVHAPAYQKMDNVEVVAACDILIDRAQRMADTFGFAKDRCFEDFHDLLALDDLDAVDIATPNDMHSVIAVAALEKGLHVFCEKPDAVSVVEVQKMQAAAKQSGKHLMVMRNNRFMAGSQFLKQYIADGNMGEIYTARCGWRRRRGIPGKGGWFTTKAKSGGGPLIDLGVHMIDLSMWLMGNPKPVAVSGCTYRKFADDTAQADSEHAKFGDAVQNGVFDVEDLCMGFIRFENGACMQIEFSWASNIEMENKFFDLRGTKAGARYSSVDEKFKIFTEQYGRNLDLAPAVPDSMGPHEANLRHFVDVVLNGATPIFEPEQGVEMVKILEAIYQSAQTGREVLL